MSITTTFSTKAYTLNSLIAEVAAVSVRVNVNTLVETLSPVAGENSAKFQAIDSWLNGYLNDVLIGDTFIAGASPRTRLLNALKYRKTHGYFYN
jgi:hypothetical protein